MNTKQDFLKLSFTLILSCLLSITAGAQTVILYRSSAQDTTKQYYLFSYFLNEHQGMCYAISTDGISWKPLNNSKPYLTPNIGKEKLMRDPSINLGPDSVYRVVWTTGWKDTHIGYAYSKDLIHWSTERLLPVMKGIPGAKMSWAPEIFYDNIQHKYMIYWSSAVDTVWSIYYTLTEDFKQFT
ncbi:MAG: hypothetical protein IRZ03_17200, partial [Acidobacterium ailaaui]|nr:hypothetical protein [Pseudacidobacterium ailaaui]